MIELELPARFDNFIKLRENIYYFLLSYNCPNNILSEILIVAEEIFTNIIRHAYKKECLEKIKININIVEDIFTLRFVDKGDEFKDIKIPETLSQIKGKVGGLGLYLIKKLSDSYRYLRDGEFNINEVTKKII